MSNCIRGRVSETGRVVLPVELRKEYRIEGGTDVLFSRTEFGIQISTIDQAIRRAQELVRRYVPADVSLVDELHKERREEAARE